MTISGDTVEVAAVLTALGIKCHAGSISAVVLYPSCGRHIDNFHQNFRKCALSFFCVSIYQDPNGTIVASVHIASMPLLRLKLFMYWPFIWDLRKDRRSGPPFIRRTLLNFHFSVRWLRRCIQRLVEKDTECIFRDYMDQRP